MSRGNFMLKFSNPSRGGADRGQGRKPIKAGERTVSISLRVTPAQRAKLATLGGAAWIRDQIEGAEIGVRPKKSTSL